MQAEGAEVNADGHVLRWEFLSMSHMHDGWGSAGGQGAAGLGAWGYDFDCVCCCVLPKIMWPALAIGHESLVLFTIIVVLQGMRVLGHLFTVHGLKG